jgi:hypothetical protein
MARIDSAVAPVTASARTRIESNHAAQPGGNSPGGRSGRNDRRLRRRSASISSAEEKVIQWPLVPLPRHAGPRAM